MPPAMPGRAPRTFGTRSFDPNGPGTCPGPRVSHPRVQEAPERFAGEAEALWWKALVSRHSSLPAAPGGRGLVPAASAASAAPAVAATDVLGDDDPVPDGNEQRDDPDDDPGDRQPAAAFAALVDPVARPDAEPDAGYRADAAEREDREHQRPDRHPADLAGRPLVVGRSRARASLRTGHDPAPLIEPCPSGVLYPAAAIPCACGGKRGSCTPPPAPSPQVSRTTGRLTPVTVTLIRAPRPRAAAGPRRRQPRQRRRSSLPSGVLWFGKAPPCPSSAA